jgi:hypothetical protein
MTQLSPEVLDGTGLQLYEIWRSVPPRPGFMLPHWQDFKAGLLVPVMREVWVLEHQPPDAMIVRFMGSEVGRLAGRDTTGQDFLKIRIAPENRASTLQIYRHTFNAPCGTQLTRLVSTPGLNRKRMRTTFFPVHFEQPDGWGLLGCSEMHTDVDTGDTGDDVLAGSADFASAQLLPPVSIDLGLAAGAQAAKTPPA